jgi:hypothetical protein
MGTKYAVFLVLLAVFACNKKTDKPHDILSQDDMVKVMAEVYIAEEKVNSLALARDSAERVFTHFQQRVFETTGIPDSVFKKSIDYYMERPKEMEKIYSVLVDSLQLREQRVSSRSTDQQ